MAKRDNPKFIDKANILFIFINDNVKRIKTTDKETPSNALYKKDLT